MPPEGGMGFQPMRTSGFQPGGHERQGQDAPGTHGLEAHATVHKRQGANLPHWTKEGGSYSVTFRLADAVPRSVQEEWRAERERFDRVSETTMSVRERYEYLRLRRERVDEYLDAGCGSCLLKDPRAADIVAGAIRHFEGQRYGLHAWCVMPNHVHAVLTPLPGFDLDKILHSWKSFTSNQINEALARSGPLWQSEPYDRLIRSEQESERQVEYVAQNPSKAGLKDWRWVWREPGQDAPDPHGLEAHATLGGDR